MKTVNIGLIGAGDISLLHAEAIRRCQGAQLLGLWNKTDGLAEEKSKLFGCKKYASAEALLADPALDAVFVLTALEAHQQYTLMALQAGKPVLVEKPVGRSVAEIESMQQAAKQAGVLCMPGHNYIYEAGVMRAKELMEEGKLGDLVSIYVLYNIHHPEAVAARYPGVIRHIMTHHAYIMLYLAGRPTRLSAMKSVIHYEQITQEDLAMVTLQLENGGLAHFCASFAADDHAGDPWTMMIKIIGTKGATRFSYRDWVENKPATVHSQTYAAYPYSIYQEVEYFVHRCLGQRAAPLSSLDDAIIAQKIIDAAERSAAEQRHIDLI